MGPGRDQSRHRIVRAGSQGPERRIGRGAGHGHRRRCAYLPQGIASPSFIPPVITLVLATGLVGGVAWRALTRLSMTQGEYNV